MLKSPQGLNNEHAHNFAATFLFSSTCIYMYFGALEHRGSNGADHGLCQHFCTLSQHSAEDIKGP